MKLFYSGIAVILLCFFANCTIGNRSSMAKRQSAQYKVNINEPVFTPKNKTEEKLSIIEVHSQEDLHELSKQIKNTVNDGFNIIKVFVDKGSYYFDDGLLSFSGMNDVDIIIEGNNSLLYGNGSMADVALTPNYAYLQDEKPVSLWSEVIQSDKLVNVVDKDKKLCRIPIAEGAKADKGDFIQISQWFKSPTYSISDVKDGYIYFEAPDLEYILTRLGWSVNYDQIYGGEKPRYRIFPHHTQNTVFLSDVVNFINVSNFSGSLSISGLHFVGSAYSSWKGVVRVSASQQTQVYITDCIFEGCRNPCINIQNSSNVIIQNCVFQNNYQGCVAADDNCRNITVRDNTFQDNGIGWTNSFNVSLSGTDFIIKSNRLVDFNYGGICVGCWWNRELNNLVTGDVCDNELYYTPEFYESYMLHSLMDGGAIYVLTQTDGITIRNNYIHDISGVKDNRGIFCDDGAKNVSITGNVIQRIQNSYCIDLRKVASVAEKVPDHNTGNACIDNLVDGDIRFYLRDGSCKESNNKKIGDRGYKTMKAYKNWEGKIK